MLTDRFDGFKKSRKHSIFMIDSYIKDSAFSAAKGKQSSKQGNVNARISAQLQISAPPRAQNL